MQNNNKLNCATARNFSIVKALEKLGYFPKKISEQEAWFLSPFRSETQASLKVSIPKNRWYDHGQGKGGNVIDLVSMLLQCSIKETLEFLEKEISIFSFQQQPIVIHKETRIRILKVQPIKHPALCQYIISRGIPLSIANAYCKEVWYGNKNRKFFAIGLQNKLGGWELRNKFYKNSSSPKSFTYYQYNRKRLLLLEGMFDLLTLATIDQKLIKHSDILVLNSISYIKRIEHLLQNYEQVILYLDNDVAGRDASTYLVENYKQVIDHSHTYQNFKDINEMLCHGKS